MRFYDATPVIDGVPVFVSAEGCVTGAGARRVDRAGQRAVNAPTELCLLLGIRDTETMLRLNEAVKRAALHRRTSTVRWRMHFDVIGKIVSVRPAREAGFAVISMTDLDAPAGEISSELLTEIFGLTCAEAEIAANLFHNCSLSDIARDRKVQLETVRGQVKAILHKVGVTSQKQLMLLLSRIALIAPIVADCPTIGELQPRAASAG